MHIILTNSLLVVILLCFFKIFMSVERIMEYNILEDGTFIKSENP